MNILIVGGAGYIGGVTAHMAQEAGHDITVLDNLSTGRPYNIPTGVPFLHGDVRDKAAMDAVFEGTQFDAVMHFAAKIVVPESVKEPYDYFNVNTQGALHVIDAAAKAGAKHYVFSSTAAVYGEPTNIPISEDNPTNPVNPYGASKLLAERILHSYQLTHNLQWIALRYFNVAGAYAGVGTDYPYVSHIIPKLLLSMHNKEPVIITGDDYDTPDGTCIRDYVHVADVAKAHLRALEAMQKGTEINQPINVSSGHGYSVRKVADTFNKVTQAHLPIQVGPRRTGDPARLLASNQRAKELLGWAPKHTLEDMIKDHYEWYITQKNPNRPIQTT